MVINKIREHHVHSGGNDIYLLFRLILFFCIIWTKFLPVPLTRPFYICLGARLGPNTYSGGAILDPPLTIIGSNTIIGEDALLKIGNGSIIAAGSVVLKKAEIGSNEIWGGVPAKFIKKVEKG